MSLDDVRPLSDFPSVLRPPTVPDGVAPVSWLAARRGRILDLLGEHGAILFRGFALEGAGDLERLCETGTPGLVHYTGGGSIRTHVAGKVYTSTEYAADQHIPLHCESTYFRDPPHFIWLYCETPPGEGGETPIGDMRRVLARLDPELVQRFRDKGVRYIYNLHGGNGLGRGWREAFGTGDREQVDAWLAAQGAEYRWDPDGTLHMDLIGPGLRTHAQTGETVWGNQAVNWHIASLSPAMAANLRRVYKSDDRLPKHATFGDGSPIPDADVQRIVEVLKSEETAFPWERNDVLLCDNQCIAHGRRPFKGERRVLVALA